jgi:hypothetical protein
MTRTLLAWTKKTDYHGRWTWCVLSLALTLVAPASASAQSALIDLGNLSRLSSQATNTVDVNVDPSMLQLAAGLLGGNAADPTIKELIAGLKGVYVRSFEFDRDGAWADGDLDAVRTQLKAPWARVVNVRDGAELVEVYVWSDGDVPGGLAVLIAQPRELTVVNVVGKIDLEQLASIGGLLGLPQGLGLPGAAAPQGPPPTR